MNKIFSKTHAAKVSMIFMCAVFFLCAGGCTTKQIKTVEEKPAYFDELVPASRHISASLARQLEVIYTDKKPAIVVDAFFNEQSAEVSVAGRTLQDSIVESLSKSTPSWPATLLGVKSLQKAQLVVGGTYKLLSGDSKHSTRWMAVKTQVQNIMTGQVIAQSEVFVDSKKFDAELIKFYKDAPMYMKTVLQKPHESFNPDRLALNAKLADAREAYESGDFTSAEKSFSEVLVQVNGKNFVALSGLYQSLIRLNRLAEAEKAFGNLVDFGLESGSLSLKFLFKVGSTDFLAKDDLSTQYPLWIRQIAQQLSSKKLCLNVNGHASRTGSPELNERLSLQRAERIVVQLKKASPSLSSGRLKAFGKGFRENIVGSGTNDTLDAIDRRVDFDVTSCK
ncbi:MAG: OmpA family protein [Desulfuromonadales bacterium]